LRVFSPFLFSFYFLLFSIVVEHCDNVRCDSIYLPSPIFVYMKTELQNMTSNPSRSSSSFILILILTELLLCG
jgi:hypothetical protein